MKKPLCILAASFLATINIASAAPTGEIMFATLTTTVNADQPPADIEATVTDGKYKGAKLHGHLVTDNPLKIRVNFTSMNVTDNPEPLKIDAYAIDANTARTALKSKTGPEYLEKNGIILATAFINGYAIRSGKPEVVIDKGTDIGVWFLVK